MKKTHKHWKRIQRGRVVASHFAQHCGPACIYMLMAIEKEKSKVNKEELNSSKSNLLVKN